jgi:hypothetical protein
MPTSNPPSGDQRRIAQFLIAAVHGDQAAADQAESEIASAPGGWRAAFTTLASLYVNMLVTVAGEAGARKTLQLAALDASLHEDDDE